MRIALFSLLLPAALLALGIDASAGDMDRRSAGLAPITKTEWTLDAAAHLLRRAGFGGTLAEISALHAKGPAGAVDSLLDWKGKPDDNLPGIRIAITSRPGREEFMGKTREQRQEMSRAHRRDDYGQIAAVREWWLQSMIATAHPARERLVLFWHGLFTSGYRDVRNSYHMYIQNTRLRRHAAGNFRELLHAISKDPAMLEYLDNNRNRKGQPNENYAREVMELFTLGEGHYTERDIKEAARALTGWTFVGNRFRFDRRQHDEGKKTILGRTGNFDGTQFLDILLSRREAYRHIAGRLFRYFAHRRPSDSDIDGLARTLARNNWELKPMLRQLFLSREFYSKRSMGTKIKAPVEMIVGLFRSLGMEADAAMGLSFQAGSLGQELMGPPNVKGWPGGREWITTSMLLNRYNICGALVGVPSDKMRTMRTQRYRGMGALIAGMRRADPNGTEDDAMVSPGKDLRRGRDLFRRRMGKTFDVVAAIRAAGIETPEQIVDHLTKTLLAVPVTQQIRQTLLDYLKEAEGDARSRLHGLLRLIVSTPEFQLT